MIINEFDTRRLHYINGKCGSAILENDISPPPELVEFQNIISKFSNFKSVVHKQYCNLHPKHLEELNGLIKDKNVKNILIDSLFKDRKQFRYIISNVFSSYTKLNFFINSHGSLLNVLQDELDNYMDMYEVRNPYYTHGGNEKPYFNDLTFTFFRNNVYEMDGDIMKHIYIEAGYHKCVARYGKDYKFISHPYHVEDDDNIQTNSKSKWD